jgi:uncharacterized protein YdhG (YjbR/CyaY superfamily)
MATSRKTRSGPSTTAASAMEVSAYLAALPAPARAVLARLRKTIKSAVPGATELISYRIPTVQYKGRHLVGYAAFENHCSFFVMSTAVMRSHARELAGYPVGKGSIRFPIDAPLPAALVKKLVRARIAETES